MSNTKLQIIKDIKVNITQGLDVSNNQQQFVLVSRYRSNNSSMFDYQIELYNFNQFNLIKRNYIYSTYTIQKHPCIILPDLKTIVVATFQHIIFYDQNLNVKHKEIHNERDVWDLQASPDSRLVVFIGGQNIMIFDSVTFKRIDYGQIKQTTKSCKFSKDSQYMGISTQDTLYIYQVIPMGYTYQMKLKKDIKASKQAPGMGIINSFDFNPTNNRQIAIAFGNASPKVYDIELNQLRKVSVDEQPNHIDNFKIVRFMPDGKRIFSADIKGMGLWPGDSDKKLVYKEGIMLHSMRPFNGGKKIFGYNWQNLKVVQVQYLCKNLNYSNVCACQPNFYWNHQTQSCISCMQGTRNICLCGQNQNFVTDLGRCVYNCASVKNSIKSIPTRGDRTVPCFCERGYVWKNGQCIFDCNSIFQSVGGGSINETCQCKQKFVWNKTSKQCVCQPNSQLVVSKDSSQYNCECFSGYQWNANKRICQPNCKTLQNALEQRDQLGNCKCKQGYQFRIYQNITLTKQQNKQSSNINYLESTKGACIRNCSMVNNTIGRTYFDQNYDSCICRQKMLWQMGECKLNCSAITNGIQLKIYQNNNTQYCSCSLGYHWVPQINQCGRSCDNVLYYNKSQFTNTQSCPCISKFQWDYDNLKICKIDCTKVNYTQSYNPKSPHSCLCNNLFYWQQASLACVIDCAQVWDAGNRSKIDECQCKNKKVFNKEKNICQLDSVQNVFSRPWIWAIIAIGIVFLIIVAAVMIKFCWKFSSNRNNKEEKRLKKHTQPVVKKRKQKQNNTGAINPISSERVQLRKQ